MITLTINAQVKNKNKVVSYKRFLKMFRSMDEARSYIKPIVSEMRIARANHVQPKEEIVACSYDVEEEKTMLLRLGALTSVENESD